MKRLNSRHERLFRKELLSIKKISITLDFWSDRTLKSYLCITCHYCTPDFDYHSKILSFSTFYDRHQGIRIAKIVREKLNYFNIFDKIQCITTDGARNMINMYQNLSSVSFDWIWCTAHRLHLLVINALGFWPEKKKKNEEIVNNNISNTIIASISNINHDTTNNNTNNINSNINNSNTINNNINDVNNNINNISDIYNNNNNNRNDSNNTNSGIAFNSANVNNYLDNEEEETVWDDAMKGKL